MNSINNTMDPSIINISADRKKDVLSYLNNVKIQYQKYAEAANKIADSTRETIQKISQIEGDARVDLNVMQNESKSFFKLVKDSYKVIRDYYDQVKINSLSKKDKNTGNLQTVFNYKPSDISPSDWLQYVQTTIRALSNYEKVNAKKLKKYALNLIPVIDYYREANANFRKDVAIYNLFKVALESPDAINDFPGKESLDSLLTKLWNINHSETALNLDTKEKESIFAKRNLDEFGDIIIRHFDYNDEASKCTIAENKKNLCIDGRKVAKTNAYDMTKSSLFQLIKLLQDGNLKIDIAGKRKKLKREDRLEMLQTLYKQLALAKQENRI